MGILSKFFKSSSNALKSNEKNEGIVGHSLPADENSKLERIKSAMLEMRQYGIYADEDFIRVGRYVIRTKNTSQKEISKAFPDMDEWVLYHMLDQLERAKITSSGRVEMEPQEFEVLIKLLTDIGGQYDYRLISMGAKFSSDLTEYDIDNKAAQMLMNKYEQKANYQDENVDILLSFGSGIIQRVDERAYTDFVQLLLTNCKPSRIRFVLISMSRRLNQFDDYPQVLIPYIHDQQSQLERFIDYLNAEIKLRRETLADIGAKDYIEYNNTVFRIEKKIIPFMLVIDELSSIKMTKSFVATLESILIYGKTCGIYLIGFSAFNGSSLRLGRLRPFLYFRDANWCLNVFSSFEKQEEENATYDSLSGEEFEKVCAKLLSQNGFINIQLTTTSGDYGGDILAEKEQIKYVIQCKRYNSSVGVSAVQEVIASRSIYKCHVGVVMTNSHFTNAAQRLADENNILLWDGRYIEKMKDDSNK